MSCLLVQEHFTRMKPGFETWLNRTRKPNVVASRLANCRRVERYYGDLDRLYDRNQITTLLSYLSYSVEDERQGRKNPSRILISVALGAYRLRGQIQARGGLIFFPLSISVPIRMQAEYRISRPKKSRTAFRCASSPSPLLPSRLALTR
jgi:hypothetical protein